LVCVLAATLVFFALRLAPGDPVDLILGESPESMALNSSARSELRHRLGLDIPAPRALLQFFSQTLRGDLGMSLVKNKPVATLIAERLPYTALLALAACLLANFIALPAGIAAALSRKRVGNALIASAVFTQSLPAFWLAPLLVAAFSLQWPWLPVSGAGTVAHLLLPTLTLAAALFGPLARATQEALSQTLATDYIRAARAKGLSEAAVICRHALPNALPPLAVVSALQFAHALGGALITETLFDWPGLGTLLMDALLARDYPVVQGIVLVTGLSYVIINATADALVERFTAGGAR
jgi:ABC-type dipeptide/oligopeptide/nickel transport system permease component